MCCNCGIRVMLTRAVMTCLFTFPNHFGDSDDNFNRLKRVVTDNLSAFSCQTMRGVRRDYKETSLNVAIAGD